MTRLPFFVAIFFIICQECHPLKPVYFWREYTGEIPDDAITAGTDINGKPIYIGQGFVKGAGLMVVQLSEGVTRAKAVIAGVKTVNKFLKILCGPQDEFYWMRGQSSSLHLDLIGKHAVIGGHEHDRGYIGVGRISHDGETKVGKINIFEVGNSKFFFDENGGERFSLSYEILMFKETAQKKDIDLSIFTL